MMEKGGKFFFWGTSTAEDEDEKFSQFMLEQEEGHTLDIVLKATIKAKSLATKQVGVIVPPLHKNSCACPQQDGTVITL